MGRQSTQSDHLVSHRPYGCVEAVTLWVMELELTYPLVFCFVGASFATGDMIMHNRRKRGEWLAEQQAKSARELEEARKAAATGIATQQQVLLLNRERAAMEAEEAKKSAKGIFTRMKETLFFSMSEEEQQGGKIGAAARAAQEKAQEKAQEIKQEVMPESNQGSGVVRPVEQKVQDMKRSGAEAVEGVAQPFGGPLDRQAQASVDAVRHQTSSWFSWVTGR